MNKIIKKIKGDWTLGMILFELLVTVVLYPWLPNSIAVHWNSQTADGFLPKYIGAFIIPAGTLISYFLRKKYDISMISMRFRIAAIIVFLTGFQTYLLCSSIISR